MVALYLFEQFLVLLDQLFSLWLLQQNNTRWLLCLSCNTQLKSASNVNVRNSKVLTQDGDVAYNVNGADISSDDTKPSGAFLDGLDDIFDTPFELFVLVQVANELQQF